MSKLVGCSVVDCFTQDKNSILIQFSDGKNNYYLQYLIKDASPIILVRDNFSRARKNTVNLFEDLISESLQNISIHKNNRIIELKFINSIMYIMIFSGSNSNVILTKSDGVIIDSFKKKKELLLTQINLPEPNLRDFKGFSSGTSIYESLAKCELLLGKYYAKELLFRLKIPSEKLIRDYSAKELKDIFDAGQKLRNECIDSNSFYIYNSKDGLLLSLIELFHLDCNYQTFSNINSAILYKLINNFKTTSFNQSFKELSNKLIKSKERLINNISRIKDEELIFERAEKYKLYAEILMSYPNLKQKKAKNIKLLDYQSNEVEIPLDENLSIIENANRYFSKSKNAKTELQIRKKRLPDLELKLMKIENAIKILNDASDTNELEKIKKNLKNMTGIKVIEENDDVSTKFREFDLGEGFILYVGKNAANNDELTMKFAKPNDLWLHARGAGGSHAVLRLNSEQKVPKNILKKAAGIVAYYSQARNAKYTPVAYTFKKYVRKPKGANTGSVIISKEEVIMCEPGLPE
jgi:predicted ribosome quality control (RQC) complex YloA/Tae2 family protein